MELTLYLHILIIIQVNVRDIFNLINFKKISGILVRLNIRYSFGNVVIFKYYAATTTDNDMFKLGLILQVQRLDFRVGHINYKAFL